jgi:hypothetical protein
VVEWRKSQVQAIAEVVEKPPFELDASATDGDFVDATRSAKRAWLDVGEARLNARAQFQLELSVGQREGGAFAERGLEGR